ncbi:MAG TPA: hypothetical protein VKP30_08125 [Polyangiaceae bacterium]|nr:hypothetical protein [Polyangiaceae bacterium]
MTTSNPGAIRGIRVKYKRFSRNTATHQESTSGKLPPEGTSMAHGKIRLLQPSRSATSLCTLGLALGCALPEMHMRKSENGIGGSTSSGTSANAGWSGTIQGISSASPSNAGGAIRASHDSGGSAAGAGATG